MTGGNSSPSEAAPPSKVVKPPRIPIKGKKQGTSPGSSRGTPHASKRKFEDLSEGDLDPLANERVSHLARYMYYSAEHITPKSAAKADRQELREKYSRAFKASQDVTFLLSHCHCHCLQDFETLSEAQEEIKRLRRELQGHKAEEDRLAQEVKALKECLDTLNKERARVTNNFDELQTKYNELQTKYNALQSWQKKMANDAFTCIMTEVWKVDPSLEVPQVEKWVDKASILKAIEESGAAPITSSSSPSRISRVPEVAEQGLPSQAPHLSVHSSGTFGYVIGPPVPSDDRDDNPPAI